MLQPQVPPRQMCPLPLVAQSVQRLPLTPQVLSPLPAAQVLPEQQPIGHEVTVQRHTPLTHCWPLPQGGLAPH
jgi:hypothetical protein